MPRFDFNPASVTSGIPVYPKGSYEIELAEPKSFYRPGKEGKDDNYGVGFRAKIVEGQYKGKPMYIACYQHTEDSRSFSKAIQMAALGFQPTKQDDEFNEEWGAADWSFNPDDKSAGEAWHEMKGKVLVIDLDVGINKDTGNQQQKTTAYRPLGGDA